MGTPARPLGRQRRETGRSAHPTSRLRIEAGHRQFGVSDQNNIAIFQALLANPLEALKSVSRDPEWKWLVRRIDGSTISSVDLQRIYLDAAKKHVSGVDEETDWVLREWESTLDILETDPMSLDDRLDWVAKRKLMEAWIESEGVSWKDDVLQSLDLEYHNINPRTSLYYGLEEIGAVQRVTDDAAIQRATRRAPESTRASARARVIQALIKDSGHRYVIDWDGVVVARGAAPKSSPFGVSFDTDKRSSQMARRLELRDPFKTYDREVKRFLESVHASEKS